MDNHSFTVDNAIILAAGFSSRLKPLSLERPKALLRVKNEILIERQIRQLRSAGISEIIVVTGYKQELFDYLQADFDVRIVFNEEFASRNNHSSIWAARNFLSNSYICSSDNYFTENVFSPSASRPYYSAVFASEATDEYCITTDCEERITGVTIGGAASWYMLGHVLWNDTFSQKFLTILENEYHLPQTRDKLWEQIYMEHLNELTLYMKKFPDSIIHEFDSLDDLCRFDASYRSYLTLS